MKRMITTVAKIKQLRIAMVKTAKGAQTETIICILLGANFCARSSVHQWRSVRVFKVFSEYPTISRKNNNLHYVAITVLFLICSFKWQI